MDKPLKPETRVVAKSDLLDAPGAEEVNEVAGSGAIVKEVTSGLAEGDLR
jgi:hypothetical protein